MVHGKSRNTVKSLKRPLSTAEAVCFAFSLASFLCSEKKSKPFTAESAEDAENSLGKNP